MLHFRIVLYVAFQSCIGSVLVISDRGYCDTKILWASQITSQKTYGLRNRRGEVNLAGDRVHKSDKKALQKRYKSVTKPSGMSVLSVTLL